MSFTRFIGYSLRAVFVAASAAMIAGCAVIYDAETNPSKPIVGLPISELAQVGQLEFHHGRLLATVDIEGMGWEGVAVIDTSADTVVAMLHPFENDDESPWSIAPFRDSLLYAVNRFGKLRVMDSSGVWTDVPVGASIALRHLMPGRDGVLLFDRGSHEVRSLAGRNSTVRLRMNATDFITGVVASGNRLLVARYNRRDLLVSDMMSGSILDSIPLDSLPGKRGLLHNPEAVIAYGGRILVAMSVADTSHRSDTALVAVFDSATLGLDTTLRLKYAYRPVDTEYPFVPRVANGKWYLPGYNIYPPTGNGGIEVINLDHLNVPPVVIDSWEAYPPWNTLGNATCDMLPTAPGKAYAVKGCNGYRYLDRLSY